MTVNTVFDVIIVGGSHAGLSAAQTLCRHGHSAVILDAGRPRSWLAWSGAVSGADKKNGVNKVVSTPIETFRWGVFGRGNQTGESLRQASREELLGSARGLVEYVGDASVSQIERVTVDGDGDGGFKALDDGGRSWLGRKLLLAVGAADHLPDIAGYRNAYPKRIFHCLFTSGVELSGAPVAAVLAAGVLAHPMHAAMLTADALKIAQKAVILTNGLAHLELQIAQSLHSLDPHTSSAVSFDTRPITAIQIQPVGTDEPAGSTPGRDADRLVVSFQTQGQGGVPQPAERVFSFMVHKPRTSPASPEFMSQLGLEADAMGNIPTVDPFNGTSQPGIFVAGDCTSLMKIVPAAQFSGAAAGAGLARALGIRQVRTRL